jgi:integrase
MNDLTTLNWKRITKVLPKSKSASSNDRAPTIEEIKKLVEYPDRRIKPIVYTMCSSGIRVGAWNYLKWKHVTPIKNDKDEIIAAKLLVYAGESEEYYTFMTPEAYNALKDWIDFRASYGEDINDKSPVMRNIWRTADIKRRGVVYRKNKKGKAIIPLVIDGYPSLEVRRFFEALITPYSVLYSL